MATDKMVEALPGPGSAAREAAESPFLQALVARYLGPIVLKPVISLDRAATKPR